MDLARQLSPLQLPKCVFVSEQNSNTGIIQASPRSGLPMADAAQLSKPLLKIWQLWQPKQSMLDEAVVFYILL
jgi:hypothetical protein